MKDGDSLKKAASDIGTDSRGLSRVEEDVTTNEVINELDERIRRLEEHLSDYQAIVRNALTE